MIQFAQFVPCTTSEGPGKRCAIWMQGCSIRCKNCINPQFFDPRGGIHVKREDLKARLENARKENHVRGVSILGGEPFDQPAGLLETVTLIGELRLDIIVFTGYRMEQLKTMTHSAVHETLTRIDVLVDGPYIHEQRVENLYLRGSKNQKITLLTSAFKETDFQRANSVDIHISGSEMVFSGFPFDDLNGEWFNGSRS